MACLSSALTAWPPLVWAVLAVAQFERQKLKTATTAAVTFIIGLLSIRNHHELAARGVVFHRAMSLDDLFESEYPPQLDLGAT